jgi:hypothetical protein
VNVLLRTSGAVKVRELVSRPANVAPFITNLLSQGEVSALAPSRRDGVFRHQWVGARQEPTTGRALTAAPLPLRGG